MNDDPVPIPARIAYLACAAVLRFRATELARRLDGTYRRRGPEAAERAASKQGGRDEMAARAERAAKDCIGYASTAKGAVDTALLGYLTAWLADCQGMMAESEAELAESGRTLDGVDRKDRAAVCRTVIGE